MKPYPRLAIVALITVLPLLIAPAAPADDWPGWRGPERDGRSAETGLLGEWPDGGPRLVLRAKGLGAGFSSLAVAGGRIYTLGDLPARRPAVEKPEYGLHAIALSTADGSVLWRMRLDEAFRDEFPGPRSTPTTDGERVWVITTNGDLACLAADSGSILWRKSLPKDFGGHLMQAGGDFDWRYTESPLLDGGRIIVTPGTKEAALVALDKATGELVWKTALPADLGPEGRDGAGYASTVVSLAGGVRQYVQLLGRGLVGVEADSGRLLWSYNRVANDVANIPTPLVDGDLVFTAAGYPTGGAALVRLHREGEGDAVRFRAEEVYFHGPDTLQNHHGQMVLHDGHVYLGHGLNRGFPVAVELTTGRFAWGPLRNAGKNSTAIIYADGRLYLRYQDGLVILVEATPEGYRERGSFTIPDVEQPSWSQPVISGGRLYLREQDRLLAYDIRGPRHEDPSSLPRVR